MSVLLIFFSVVLVMDLQFVFVRFYGYIEFILPSIFVGRSGINNTLASFSFFFVTFGV